MTKSFNSVENITEMTHTEVTSDKRISKLNCQLLPDIPIFTENDISEVLSVKSKCLHDNQLLNQTYGQLLNEAFAPDLTVQRSRNYMISSFHNQNEMNRNGDQYEASYPVFGCSFKEINVNQSNNDLLQPIFDYGTTTDILEHFLQDNESSTHLHSENSCQHDKKLADFTDELNSLTMEYVEYQSPNNKNFFRYNNQLLVSECNDFVEDQSTSPNYSFFCNQMEGLDYLEDNKTTTCLHMKLN